MDEDEAAAAADFTPMTEEKRIFVEEWIAKLGEETPDDEMAVQVGPDYARADCSCEHELGKSHVPDASLGNSTLL